MRVMVYGHSDDCIEIEGDIRDEFSAFDAWKYLHFDDGTLLKVGYDKVPDKGWSITPMRIGAGAAVRPLEPIMDDGQHYSDHLELTGKFTRVRCFASETGPTDEEVRDFFENMDPRDVDLPKLRQAFEILS